MNGLFGGCFVSEGDSTGPDVVGESELLGCFKKVLPFRVKEWVASEPVDGLYLEFFCSF